MKQLDEIIFILAVRFAMAFLQSFPSVSLRISLFIKYINKIKTDASRSNANVLIVAAPAKPVKSVLSLLFSHIKLSGIRASLKKVLAYRKKKKEPN